MKKIRMHTAAVFAVCALTLALLGCQKNEGPAETAGKKIDKSTQKMGNKIENAGDKIQDAVNGDKK